MDDRLGIYDYWVDDVSSEPGVTARQKYVEILYINIKSSLYSVLCQPKKKKYVKVKEEGIFLVIVLLNIQDARCWF